MKFEDDKDRRRYADLIFNVHNKSIIDINGEWINDLPSADKLFEIFKGVTKYCIVKIVRINMLGCMFTKDDRHYIEKFNNLKEKGINVDDQDITELRNHIDMCFDNDLGNYSH